MCLYIYNILFINKRLGREISPIFRDYTWTEVALVSLVKRSSLLALGLVPD